MLHRVPHVDQNVLGNRYAVLSRFTPAGYSWYGCTGSAAAGGGASPDPPRATEWDVDFGEPSAPCKETAAGSGIFSRDWGKATVSWDCSTGLGDIKMKAGFEHELTNPPLKGKSAWTAEVVSK